MGLTGAVNTPVNVHLCALCAGVGALPPGRVSRPRLRARLPGHQARHDAGPGAGTGPPSQMLGSLLY